MEARQVVEILHAALVDNGTSKTKGGSEMNSWLNHDKADENSEAGRTLIGTLSHPHNIPSVVKWDTSSKGIASKIEFLHETFVAHNERLDMDPNSIIMRYVPQSYNRLGKPIPDGILIQFTRVMSARDVVMILNTVQTMNDSETARSETTVHVNGGTHGGEDGSNCYACTEDPENYQDIRFTNEDFNNIREHHVLASFKQVDLETPPLYCGARITVNAWCHSDNGYYGGSRISWGKGLLKEWSEEKCGSPLKKPGVPPAVGYDMPYIRTHSALKYAVSLWNDFSGDSAKEIPTERNESGGMYDSSDRIIRATDAPVDGGRSMNTNVEGTENVTDLGGESLPDPDEFESRILTKKGVCSMCKGKRQRVFVCKCSKCLGESNNKGKKFCTKLCQCRDCEKCAPGGRKCEHCNGTIRTKPSGSADNIGENKKRLPEKIPDADFDPDIDEFDEFTEEIVLKLEERTTSKSNPIDPSSSNMFRIVLIGSMGCGKSTFTKAVCGNDTAIAGVDDEGNGVTRDINAYFIKESICKRLGVKQACILDVPGTGDPTLPIAKLIAGIEMSLSAAEVHAIILMNVASDSRVNMGVRIATTLLEKSFVQSADQIIGVMTQADGVKPRKAKKNRQIWVNVLSKAFGTEIPVVLCALPVMDEEPFDVLEPEQFEEWDIDWDPEGPSIDATLDELTRLAKDPKVAQYVEATEEVVKDVAIAMGVDIEDMQAEMNNLKAERENARAAQEELRGRLSEMEAKHGEELMKMNILNAKTKMISTMKDDLIMNQETIIMEAYDESDCMERMYAACMKSAEKFVQRNDVLKTVPMSIVEELQTSFTVRYQKAYERQVNYKSNEIYRTVKESVLEDMEEIIMQSTDVEDCISIMRSSCDAHAITFVESDNFFKEVPYETVDALKEALHNSFEKKYIAKKLQKQDAMASAVKDQILDDIDNIVMESMSLVDCEQRLQSCCESLAQEFVDQDDFLQTVPEQVLELLTKNLSHHFKKEYKKLDQEKKRDCIGSINILIYQQKTSIMRDAKDAVNCVEILFLTVDKAAEDFVKQDDFMKVIPQAEIDSLKSELRPEWEEQYNKQAKKKRKALGMSVRADIYSEKDTIVQSSESLEECIQSMEALIHEKVRSAVDLDDFFHEVPEGIINIEDMGRLYAKAYKLKEAKLKQEAEISKKMHDVAFKAAVDTLRTKVVNLVGQRVNDIYNEATDLEHCLELVYEACTEVAQKGVETSELLESIPLEPFEEIVQDFEKICRKEYVQTEEELLKKLRDRVYTDVYKKLEKLVSGSTSENSCKSRLGQACQQSAKEWVTLENFFQTKAFPETIVQQVWTDLEGDFIQAYRSKKKQHEDALIRQLQSIMINNKESLIMQASSASNCQTLTEALIDKTVKELVQSDGFLQEPPSNLSQRMDNFKQDNSRAWIDKLKESKKHLFLAVKDVVSDQVVEIVQEAYNEKNLLEILQARAHRAAVELVKTDRFLKEVPAEIPKGIVKTYGRHFTQRYIKKVADEQARQDRKVKEARRELEIYVRQRVVENTMEVQRITRNASSLNDCLTRMGILVEQKTQEFVANNNEIKDVPKDLEVKMKSTFERTYVWQYNDWQDHLQRKNQFAEQWKREIARSMMPERQFYYKCIVPVTSYAKNGTFKIKKGTTYEVTDVEPHTFHFKMQNRFKSSDAGWVHVLEWIDDSYQTPKPKQYLEFISSKHMRDSMSVDDLRKKMAALEKKNHELQNQSYCVVS